MPRAGLTRQAVVGLALAVVDEGGPTAELTLAAVAARAHVAVPSLYKHVGGLGDLRREVALVAVRGLAAALRGAGPPDDAGPGSPDGAGSGSPDGAGPGPADGEASARGALARTAYAVRDYAHRFPGRYAAAQVAPDPTDPANAELLAANEDAVRATAAALAPVTGGLAGPDLVHAVRAVRAAVHGFVLLEQRGGFGLPEDVDASFAHLVTVLEVGLAGAERPALA